MYGCYCFCMSEYFAKLNMQVRTVRYSYSTSVLLFVFHWQSLWTATKDPLNLKSGIDSANQVAEGGLIIPPLMTS